VEIRVTGAQVAPHAAVIRRVVRAIRLLAAAGLCAGTAACAGAPVTTAEPAPARRADSSRFLVPAGFGSLRQDDISIRLQVLGLQVQAIPVDETIIRLLSPDSYRTMQELLKSHRPELETITRRTGLREFSIWYVLFFGLQQGETPFSPMEFIITSVGRDFRALDVVPLTPGFGRQRLSQRERQAALFVFDPQVDVNQPLTVQFQTARSGDWTLALSRIERERALVRSRAGIRDRPPPRSGRRQSPTT
jgi:hypothetical protein